MRDNDELRVILRRDEISALLHVATHYTPVANQLSIPLRTAIKELALTAGSEAEDDLQYGPDDPSMSDDPWNEWRTT